MTVRRSPKRSVIIVW